MTMNDDKTAVYELLRTVNFLLQQKFTSVNSMLTIFCYKQFCWKLLQKSDILKEDNEFCINILKENDYAIY